MPLTLEEYDHRVGHHLRMIRHHAAGIASHVLSMSHQPSFETMAETDLVNCDETLASILATVRLALQDLRRKDADV